MFDLIDEATIKKNHSNIPDLESTLLSCLNKSIKGQEARRNSVATRSLKSNGCQEWSTRNVTRTLSKSGGNKMRSTEILSEPMDGRKNIADTCTTSRRSTSESNITLACNDEDRQAGPMKARKDFRPTTKMLASLRQEQGRQNSFIPKIERMRQRPFDEAMQAKLEWMTQNWSFFFLATFLLIIIFTDHQWQDHQWQGHEWRDHKW